jgi:hypothetical protein
MLFNRLYRFSKDEIRGQLPLEAGELVRLTALTKGVFPVNRLHAVVDTIQVKPINHHSIREAFIEGFEKVKAHQNEESENLKKLPG